MSLSLDQNSMIAKLSNDGKECQLLTYQEKPDVVVLDLDTKNHSGLTVLKYLKLNHSQIRIVVTISGNNKLSEMELSESDLKKFGVSDILVKPYTIEALMRIIGGQERIKEWKTKTQTGVSQEEKVLERDELFTQIHMSEFCSGNQSSFDYFIRLSPGNYVKILHKGEKLDPERFKYYKDEKKTEFLFFKTKDRVEYISYINEIVKRALTKENKPTETNFILTKSATEKYIDEIYTKGINPGLLEEGLSICENMYTMISRDANLMGYLKEYEKFDGPTRTHLFLTTFFAIIICSKLDWATKRTIQIIAIGALLHDIGKLKLPENIREKDREDLSIDDIILYDQHPRLGYELLDSNPGISESIKQIVFQHHETNDGLGYPTGLNSHKIFPMAKIVGLADHFSHILIKNKLSPSAGLRKMVEEGNFTYKYDSDIIKALFQAFMKDKK